MTLVRSVLHRLSCSHETARNSPKYEFWVQQSGSGAFVVKLFDVTWFSKLVRKWHQFGQFCIDFPVVMQWFGTPQNMSFGFNGVDQVRLLLKMPTQIRLAILCINSASSARFASTFVQ
jgi:hypothetical protein